MSKPKQATVNKVIELASAYAHTKHYADKNLHLVAEIGYLSGWLATIAQNDWTVRNELQARLEQLGVDEASTEIVNKRKYTENDTKRG
jgi:hypothetical protein